MEGWVSAWRWSGCSRALTLVEGRKAVANELNILSYNKNLRQCGLFTNPYKMKDPTTLATNCFLNLAKLLPSPSSPESSQTSWSPSSRCCISMSICSGSWPMSTTTLGNGCEWQDERHRNRLSCLYKNQGHEGPLQNDMMMGSKRAEKHPISSYPARTTKLKLWLLSTTIIAAALLPPITIITRIFPNLLKPK